MLNPQLRQLPSPLSTKGFFDLRNKLVRTGFFFEKRGWLLFLLSALLVFFYIIIAWVARGDEQWWYIDFVNGANVYWGDDSHRYYLARSAWLNSDIYWFNFVLPLAIFLDAILTTISSDSLFVARALKSLPLVASLFFLYFSCRNLGVKRSWSFLAVGLLAFTPIYVFVSLSFYGESWFVFFVSVTLLFLSQKKLFLAAVVIGLMPLVRIESLDFVATFAIFTWLRKDFRAFLTVFAPGTVYFLLIVTAGPGVEVFLSWRFEMMKVYQGVGLWYGGEPVEIFDILFFPWLLLAVYGLFLKEARPIWVISVGVALIILHVILTLIFETGSLEPRFLVVAFPVMTIGFALALSRIEILLSNIKNATLAFSSVAIFFILYSNIYSIHVVKEIVTYFSENYAFPESVREDPLNIETYFRRADKEKVSGYREYANVAMEMIEKNPEISTLVVSDPNVLYFLDPNRIQGKAVLVFALFGWKTLSPVIQGDLTYGYFAQPPFSSYFHIDMPENGKELLLYLDSMGISGYPYHWEVKGNDIYLFSAHRVDDAKINQMPKK